MEEYDNDPVLKKYKFPTSQTESDAKRLAAINSKLETEKASKQLIKSALSGQVMNKKIVFNNPIPKKQKKEEPKPESFKSKNLFDEDDDGLDENESFKLDIPSKRFKNSKESKIIELQSRFAHDPRFKIDDKFIEDDDDSNHHKDDSKMETEKDLDILEEVLGKPLKRKFKHSEQQQLTNSIIIPRYDPTKPESQKFKIRKVDKLEPYQLPDEEKDEPIDKPEISKERFYEISETFKKDFNDDQTGQSFSLTAMFGRPVAEIPETSVEIGAIKSKRSKSHDEDSKRSTKKLESKRLKSSQESDSNEKVENDSDEDDNSKNKKKSDDQQKSIDSQSNRLNKSKVSNPLLKYERFFFTNNDERFTNNTFYNLDRIKSHISSWNEKKEVMATALTKIRRHYKHVSKLKSALETGDSTDKDLRLKYRIYKETTKKH